MSTAYAVSVMMSNYFHDVATAMIMACAVGLRLMLRHYEGGGSGSADFMLRLYRGMRGVVIFSWAWILSAGLLRLATFRSYEWPIALIKGQEAGLLVKYGIALVMVLGGSYLWLRTAQRMKTLAAAGPGR